MSPSATRTVRLFRNGRNQAVRIPVEFELPEGQVTMTREGARLILEPVEPEGLLEYLQTLEPIEEEFPEIDDPPPEPVDCFD